ncbi:MAG: Mth938-like domain-containing protein [Proteobacteria bacterium]|nr:Mth938-like domain-containing protein [Pseudomonadota bacterium]
MTDIGPAVPSDKQLVQGYGAGLFRISGEAYETSILLFPDRVLSWPVADFSGVTLESLQPIMDAVPSVELVLLGCGPRMAALPAALRAALKAKGIGLEPMDTGAACRTYNVLMAEDRRVAAALIALPRE